MKRICLYALSIAAAAAFTPFAHANSFTFAIDGTNFQSDLTFTASQIAGQPAGVDLITGVTGWFSDPATGRVDLAANPATVVPTGVTPPGAVTQYFGGKGFIFDNVLYSKAAGAGILDWNGLLLAVNGSYYLNIFGNGTYFYFADNGSFYSDSNPIQTFNGAPALLAPEPSSLLLLGTALLIVALTIGWRGRHARAASRARSRAV